MGIQEVRVKSMDETKAQDLIEFPCHYQFKAVGDAGDEFKQGIIDSVNKYIAISTNSVKSRPSGKGTINRSPFWSPFIIISNSPISMLK